VLGTPGVFLLSVNCEAFSAYLFGCPLSTVGAKQHKYLHRRLIHQ